MWDTLHVTITQFSFGCRLPSPVSMTYKSHSPDGSSGVLTGQGYTGNKTDADYKVNISSINTQLKFLQDGPHFQPFKTDVFTVLKLVLTTNPPLFSNIGFC